LAIMFTRSAVLAFVNDYLNTSGRKTLPTLCAAGLDDGAAGAGRHACTESVSASALQEAWLKCTLHVSCPSIRFLAVKAKSLARNGRQKRGIVTSKSRLNK
jgi:hypothetical protein